MHRELSGRVGARRRRYDERGAVAIIMALAMVGMLISVGLVMDFGLVKVDRQVAKAAADAATLAGAHALYTEGSDAAHPYAGVCAAARYLQVNDDRFAGLDPTSGWANGIGVAEPSGCTSTALQQARCVPGDRSTWAVYHWTGTWQGMPISVTIQSGYSLVDSGWAEDSLPASVADADDGAQGCYQIATMVTEHRHPGFGSLAGSGDLVTSVRSVARDAEGPSGYAPALLLLQQTGCPTLWVNGSGSRIATVGALSSSGGSQPGTIHSDSDGAGCGSTGSIFEGDSPNGIVAYAAPQSSDPSAADPAEPGRITAYAGQLGATSTALRDSATNVCGAAGLYPAGTCPGPADVSGTDRVYRLPVDERYLTAVQGMRDHAVFTDPTGAKVIHGCSPTAASISNLSLTAADTVYVDCTGTGNSGFSGIGTGTTTINAGTVIFAGSVNPKGTLSLPNATRVYVVGTGLGSSNKDALSLTNGNAFTMHSSNPTGASNLATTGRCSDAATGTSDKAVLVVEGGDIGQTGGSLQMCYTTVLLEGGRATACLPTAPSTAAPDPATPCGGSSGNGQLAQTGGTVDWTAPNQYSTILQADGTPDPVASQSWADWSGPEDLALWSESGASSNPSDTMSGGSSTHLVGVLMVPNAEPFTLSGGAGQTLTNAQYVVGSVEVSGGAQITMTVDPDSVVTMPQLTTVGLVR